MRPVVSAISLILTALGLSTYAHARPYRVDYHGAICEPQAGGSNTSTDRDGIHAITNSTVVCPLNNIVSVGDGNLANMLFKVRYVGSISCVLHEDGAEHVAFSASASDTPILTSSAMMNLSMPSSASSFPPMNMFLTCDLTAGSSMQTIQVNTWTGPAPP